MNDAGEKEGHEIADFGLRIADFQGSTPQSEIRNPKLARTLVALATYNEINNLPGLVEEIHRILPEADVLVVDDNSPDRTGEWCAERVKSDSRLRYLPRPGKLGLGSALLAAMRFAVDGPYDVLVTMDADWSHDPQYLRALVEGTDSADVALGSRYCEKGGIDGWPFGRRILSRGVNWLSGLLLRIPVRDSSGAFRAYRVTALKKIDLDALRSTGYAYMEEILWHLHRSGARLVEVPITFRERRAGKSKINTREAIGKLGTLLRLSVSGAPRIPR
jgi:dolichol-phosphate mannosyltransferase